MKKAILLLVSALLAVNVMAQQEIRLRSADRAECNSSDYQQLRATFSFSNITAEEVDTERGQFSCLSMPNTVIGGNEGDPLIPVVNELIAVPFGAQPTIRVTSYSATDYRLNEEGLHTLAPRQPSLRKDQNPEDLPFVYNAAAYQTRGLRSEPRAVVNVVGTMRGIQLGKMTIEPVSYDPVDNIFRVFNDIEVEVSFDGADAQATKQMLIDTYSPYFDAVYKQLFNGRAVLDAYTDYPDLYTTPVKMLVVTTEKYSTCDAFNNWLIWKKQKGIDVDVQLVTPETPADDVRSLIQARYNANHPTFLVIVGDREDVTNYTEYEVSGLNYNPYVSDNQYASIDSDVYHDMFMSRMSVSTTEELANLVNKTLQYEQYTMPEPSYLNNVLLIAGNDSGGHHLTVGRPTIQYASNYYFNAEHGFSDVNEFITDTYSDCYTSLSSGVGFANYTGHGLINGLSNPAFMTGGSYNYTVEKLTNTDKYFWLMACCCLSANWGYHHNLSTDLNVSLGEALIRSEKGAFGYIGSVSETYWDEDYYFGVGATTVKSRMPLMNETATGVYDAMFMDDNWNTLNSMPFFGNVAVTYAHAGSYDHSTNDEYYWRAYQCLGDGSVMPYHVEPTANNVSHADNMLIGAPTFTVNADAGSYVSITMNDEIVGVAQVPASGTVDVPIAGFAAPGTAMIVVTRQQRQPYIGSITIEGAGEQFNITCNAVEHGTISIQTQAYAGALVTLTATADVGYCLDSWEVRDANNNLLSVADNKFVMPNSNVTVSATFVPGYTVTLASVMNGSISANPVFAKQGTTITLTAKPEVGYNLINWVVFKTGDLSTSIEVNDNSFILPNYDVTVSAIFLSSQSGGEVTIGNGTNSSEHLPIDVYYKLSTSQQIYTSAELGMAGTITAISFNYKSTASSGERNIDIYLSHTNRTSLSTSWVAQQTTDLVYSGTQTFASAGWCTITLDTPFEYDGESNLLLTVDDNTKNYYVSSKMYFYTYYTGTTRASYKYDDNYNVNPINPSSSSSYKPTTSYYNSQVKFTKVTPAYISLSSNALFDFTYVVGVGPSATQSIAIIGANMQDDLTVTAPTGFEVSQNQTGTFSSTLTLSPSEGSLQTMVYVRLAAGLDEGSYNGTMTIASGNASASVSLSGEVSAAFVFTKTINAHTENGGWYLIASPVVEAITPSANNGFITDEFGYNIPDGQEGTYDLFYFDQTGGENHLEWMNYRENSFNIVNGTGYLYANKNGTTLTFTGTPYNGDGTVTLSKTDNPNADFPGWNLVGNPFAQTAFISKEFYTLNEDGSEVTPSEGNSVEAMEGIFVIAEENGETLTFSTNAPEPSTGKGSLSLNVVRASNHRGGNNFVDRAIIRFGEGGTLRKFQLNPNHTKVYFTVNGTDYAVANVPEMGEMPVCFKAENDGSYNLNFSNTHVEFNYLHLIDNITGDNVDLLVNPSYTFNAKTTDYASRFKLVFATGLASDGSFAFFSNDGWVINNEGKATLQVIDIKGRILSSENISGCCVKSLTVASGVYMLRLINGNSVKTQKIIVD